MHPGRLQSELTATGFTVVRDDVAPLDIAYTLGQAIPAGRNETLSTRLETPAGKSEEILLHTDKCYWRIPPRYLILRIESLHGVVGGETILADLREAAQLVSSADQDLLRNTLVTFSAPSNRSAHQERACLLATQWNEEDVARLRLDLISPQIRSVAERWSARAKSIAVCVAALPGETLVLDNWRIAHGRLRTDVAPGGRRLATRVLVI